MQPLADWILGDQRYSEIGREVTVTGETIIHVVASDSIHYQPEDVRLNRFKHPHPAAGGPVTHGPSEAPSVLGPWLPQDPTATPVR
ncbi:hypothetical protein ACIBG0_38935 [Nocardia sp. NPDC050630]|uniref:hypothetical protein n=1 Tax=Nocardia sp. NPDC050630 TaxID=3364321 RepID=UPI00379065CE